jgi:hypothetical protein
MTAADVAVIQKHSIINVNDSNVMTTDCDDNDNDDDDIDDMANDERWMSMLSFVRLSSTAAENV